MCYKRFRNWLVIAALLGYCTSYYVWSRRCFAVGNAAHFQGFWFITMEYGNLNEQGLEICVATFYFPLILVDQLLTGRRFEPFPHKYSQAGSGWEGDYSVPTSAVSVSQKAPLAHLLLPSDRGYSLVL